jgi:hypothetical protein
VEKEDKRAKITGQNPKTR